MKIFPILWLLVAAIIAISRGHLYNDFSKEVEMHLLDGNTVDNVLLNENVGNIWLMQFFSHWCGSCQNFVPKWIKIVSAAQQWNPIVKSAALDCAENSKVCRKYRVNGYPCIRLYWPAVSGQTFHDFGNVLPFNHVDLTTRIAKAIVALATNVTSRSQLPPVAKYLLPVRLSSESLWNFRDSAVEKLFIIESETEAQTYGAIGPLVCLNTSSLHNSGRLHVKYALMSKSDERNIQDVVYSKLRLRVKENTNLPILILMDADAQKGVKVIRKGRSNVLAYFENLSDFKHRLAETTTTGFVSTTEFDATETSVWLYEDDLYGAVYNFINHEVNLHEHLNPERMSDLRKFLSVIVDFVPFPTTAVAESIRSIHTAISGKNAPTEMPISEWLDIVRDADLPPARTWKHCKGSKPQFRGYPCSLWLLFHTITSNAARQPDSFEIQTTFPAIRGFVRSFFGCRECAGHFWNATEKYVHTPNSEAHVLLWKIHNRVNNRLAGAISEDPLAPKIQFPPLKICPQCQHEEAGLESDIWDRRAVAAFLRRYYSPESIIPLSDYDSNYGFTARPIDQYLFKTD